MCLELHVDFRCAVPAASKSNVQELHKLRMSDALERKAARDAEVQDIWLSCLA